MPKQVTFRPYWQVFSDVTIDLPDDIDPNDENAVKEFVHKRWENMPFPKTSETLAYSDEIDDEHGFVITEKKPSIPDDAIIVPIPHCNGSLMACKTSDDEYPGICISFRSNDGKHEHDIAVVEAPIHADKNEINTFYYGDPETDDWTDKHGMLANDLNKE